jgi:hypothetical protein
VAHWPGVVVRRAYPLVVAVLCAVAAGCGEAPRATPRQPVQLTLSAPQDGATTKQETVRVAGRVAPRTARVLVRGERVPVRDGRFVTVVDLREGSNVIDVGASAPGARATWRALRVTRRSRVALPDVVGSEADAAESALTALGLEVRIAVDDDLLDVFRDGPRVVCSTDPDGGTELLPGSEVEVVVSKKC